MRRFAMKQECFEVCDGDRLYGYVIFFSGYWNAYHSTSPEGGLYRVGGNFDNETVAMAALIGVSEQEAQALFPRNT